MPRSSPRGGRAQLDLTDALVGHLFFKCDEMGLSWVFTVKTLFILRKISLNSCLKGLSQLYTGRASGSSTGNQIKYGVA